VGPIERAALLSLACAGAAQACEFPEQGGSPLRAAVSAVKYLPETEAWEKALPAGTFAQYLLHLDRTRTVGGICHWTLEVRAGSVLWKRFLVTPGGGRAFQDPADR
jgi:hypothetical protein